MCISLCRFINFSSIHEIPIGSLCINAYVCFSLPSFSVQPHSYAYLSFTKPSRETEKTAAIIKSNKRVLRFVWDDGLYTMDMTILRRRQYNDVSAEL